MSLRSPTFFAVNTLGHIDFGCKDPAVSLSLTPIPSRPIFLSYRCVPCVQVEAVCIPLFLAFFSTSLFFPSLSTSACQCIRSRSNPCTHTGCFDQRLVRIFLQKLSVAEKRLKSYQSLPTDPFHEIISSLDIWVINQGRIINILLSKNTRIVPIRKFLGIVENHQINSLQNDARSMLHVTASRRRTQSGPFSEVLFAYQPQFSVNRPVP